MRISVTVYALAIVGVCLAVILYNPFAELIGNSLMGLTAVIFNAIFGALDWGFPTLPTSPTGAGVYAVCMAWGLLAAVPFILLYGVTAHIVGADAKDKDVNPFWDFLGEHSFVIGFILVVGVLVGGYFHIASADVMGGVAGASWGDGIFDWIVAFCVNWASIYSWYVLPIILAALVSAFVFWLMLHVMETEDALGGDPWLMGVITVGVPAFCLLFVILDFILSLILEVVLIVVAFFALAIGGSKTAEVALDDGKIHGHIDSNGDVTIDKW